jgi:copper oxidase (laccase) domain-containing protein
MLPGKIYHAGQCTACRGDLYYSYRREGGSAGRMMAVIGATNAAPMAGLTPEV